MTTTSTEYSQFPGAGGRIDPADIPRDYFPSAGSSWLAFAAVVFLVAGIFNIIDGIVALTRTNYLSNDVLVGNLQTWGWSFVFIGILQLFVSGAILNGRRWAAIVGVVLAVANLIDQMLFVRTYPIWSLLIIAMDVIVIYALIVYGGRRSVADAA